MKQRIRKIGDPERNPVYTTRSFPFPIVGLQIGRAGASYCMPRNIINNFQVISAEVERGGTGSRSNGPRRRSVHRGNHEAGMDGEGWTRKTGGGGRGTRGKRNNERDAYVSFLIVTGSTLRYRPREARPCHYYPIISCITVTVNEVSYYAARRGGGWKKRGERRPYVSRGGGLAVGRCALDGKKKEIFIIRDSRRL